MKKIIALFVAGLFIAGNAYAHDGDHKHKVTIEERLKVYDRHCRHHSVKEPICISLRNKTLEEALK